MQCLGNHVAVVLHYLASQPKWPHSCGVVLCMHAAKHPQSKQLHSCSTAPSEQLCHRVKQVPSPVCVVDAEMYPVIVMM